MLIDTSLTIAYKCPSCGSFEFFSLSIFKLLQQKEYVLNCHCNHSHAALSLEHSGDFRVNLGCIGCGGEHIYLLSRKEMLGKSLHAFHCPLTGVQQCFIGKDEEVRARIDSLEKELDALIDLFGYESYFKNTRVMFDSLNRVHDIAEQGNLTCECGHQDIELRLLSDRIHLQCRRCARSLIISAASNEDLKEMAKRRQILLQSTEAKDSVYSSGFAGHTDGK